MNETEFDQLIETARVRRLTPGEQARLRGWLLLHPEAQFVWDEEEQLTQHLRGLPRDCHPLDALRTAEQIREAAETLVATGWLCLPSRPTRFGPRAPVCYHVNPRLRLNRVASRGRRT